MNTYEHIRERAFQANRQLPGLGLVLFTFGNVSAVDRDLGVFAIKPSGVPYQDLSADKMVIVDFDAKIVDGRLRPSSDTKTHAVLYKHWEKIGGISHTHSTYATAWAARGEPVPCILTMMADEFGGEIPVGPFAVIGDD
ncbi:MAG TPA: class II aldolase/adducin family protein, partial [Chitinophagaceae bacterium]|nr:class II aldolase/adducin family protein [Chitinophagaceae bacterium]